MSRIIVGDALTVLRGLDSESVQCCVTSPPYWGLRDYGAVGQLGIEKTPVDYVTALVEVFREVRRVLKKDGTLWLNLGDSYATGAGSARSPGGKCFGKANKAVDAGAFPYSQPNRMPIEGLKPKDLVGIPWRVAFALQADGWYLRQDIIWHKSNPMPESVTDRCTRAHEYIFLFSKSQRYYFDYNSIKEPAIYQEKRNGRVGAYQSLAMRNKGDGTTPTGVANRDTTKRHRRSVWKVPTKPFKGAHFATFPADLIEPCVLAGASIGSTVLDTFFGAGTTGLVSESLGREFIGIELNPEYARMAAARILGAS